MKIVLSGGFLSLSLLKTNLKEGNETSVSLAQRKIGEAITQFGERNKNV